MTSRPETTPSTQTRPVAMGADGLVVQSNRPDVVTRLDHLLSSLPAPPDGASTMTISVDAINEPNDSTRTEYRTSVNGESLLTSPHLAAHEMQITRFINTRKLDTEQHLLHLHSAAVERDGDAVLIVGRSGDGKSTLTAGLTQRGWAYLGDEQLALNPADVTMSPYARPITLRRAVWPLFDGLSALRDGLESDPARERLEVSPGDLGRVHTVGSFAPAMIVAPLRQPGEPTTLDPLGTVADVVHVLASSCYDSDRLGPDGFELLVQLAQDCPAWRLTYSDLDDADRQMSAAFGRRGEHVTARVRHFPPVPTTTVARAAALPDTIMRSRGAHGWAFGDGSGIVFDPVGRRMSSLDTAGITLWELLEQPQAIDELMSFSSDQAGRDGLRAWMSTLSGSGLLQATEPVSAT